MMLEFNAAEDARRLPSANEIAMRLVQIRKTLLAADRSNTRLRVRRMPNVAAVHELAQAGLVEATFADGSAGSETAIRLVTEAGHRFLRTFGAGYRFCDGG